MRELSVRLDSRDLMDYLGYYLREPWGVADMALAAWGKGSGKRPKTADEMRSIFRMVTKAAKGETANA